MAAAAELALDRIGADADGMVHRGRRYLVLMPCATIVTKRSAGPPAAHCGIEIGGRLGGHDLRVALARLHHRLDAVAHLHHHVVERLERLLVAERSVAGDDLGLVVHQRQHALVGRDHAADRASREHVDDRVAGR
jgi:hypothetical protein